MKPILNICVALPAIASSALGGLTGPVCNAALRAGYTTVNPPYVLEYTGDTLFTLIGSEAVVALDVTDPIAPVELDRFDASGQYMELVGDVIYCYQGTTGERTMIQLLDVSDPGDIQLIGAYPMHSDPSVVTSVLFGMDIEDSIGYFSYFAPDASGGIRVGMSIIDFSDPMSPVYIADHVLSTGFVPFPGVVRVSGSYLYTLQFDLVLGRGIEIFDLSDPMNFASVGFIPNSNYRDLYIHDSHLYTTGISTEVYDLSTPASPTLLASFPNIGNSISMHFFGEEVFVGTLIDGIRRYDISDPSMPDFVISYENFTAVSSCATDGSVLYGASTNGTDGPREIEIGLIEDCDYVCSADLTGDGFVDFLDISLFIQLYNSMDLSVDFNSDAAVDFLDISEFLDRYAFGC